MKTIKFQSLNERRKETSNIEDYEIINYKINGKKLKVYSNCNLVIYVNKYCNCKCDFCMNKFNPFHAKSNVLPQKEYLNKVENLLIELKDLNPTVSIGGGEPTKSNLLAPILKLLKKHNYRSRTFPTNGTGLFDIYDGKPQIEHLVKEGFKNINLSVAHYDENINANIMNYVDRPLSNEEIKTIAYYSKANNIYLRMSCVLCKNGISTLNDLIKYFNFYLNIGINNCLFREQIKIKNDNYLKNFVNIDKIALNIKNDKRFTFIRRLEGLYYKVDVYKYENNNDEFLVKIYDEKKISNDIIRDIILYPNGELIFGFKFDNKEYES